MSEELLSLAVKAFFEKHNTTEALALLEKCRAEKLPETGKLRFYTLTALAAFKLGRVKDAVEAYRLAAECCNDRATKLKLLSNYLMYLHYLPDVSDEFLRAEHFRYNELFRDIVPFTHHRRERSRLRIGYLAPTFSTHIVINFAVQLLAQYDRSCFEIICYDLAEKENRTTGQIKQLVNGWRNLHGLTAGQAAKRIFEDEIDILVDLGGHTDGGSTLRIMAYKPAPVQLSMIGYFDTTGLSVMDYFLGDVYCDADETLPLFREKVLRLPHSHLCYTPSEAAAKTEINYTGHEQVVFGSFNNYAKVTDEMLAVWKKILDSVPQSRLILKNVAPDAEAEAELKKRAEGLGFSSEQLELRQGSFTYIKEYADIDIALDTYPYPGGGTTCEALYMGVPVVSRYGVRHGSRFGYSLLMNCGIGELAAGTEKEYIEKAVALANDRELLSVLHQNLRLMMQKSPLMDGCGYTRDMEAAYNKAYNMWREQHR